MAPFVGDFYFLFFLTIKSSIFIKKEPRGSKKYTGSIQKGAKWGQEKKTARKTAAKNLPAQAKTRQSYLHPIQDKKSTKEFVLSTVYKLAQDHKLLKKVAFVL